MGHVASTSSSPAEANAATMAGDKGIASTDKRPALATPSPLLWPFGTVPTHAAGMLHQLTNCLNGFPPARHVVNPS